MQRYFVQHGCSCAGRQPSTTQATTQPIANHATGDGSNATSQSHTATATNDTDDTDDTSSLHRPYRHDKDSHDPAHGNTGEPCASHHPAGPDRRDKVGYGISHAAGRRIHDRLKEDGRTADPLKIIRGMMDGPLEDKDPALQPAGSGSCIQGFPGILRCSVARRRTTPTIPAFRKQADDNLQKSRAILDQNAEMAGVEVRPDGVQVQVLSPGNGRAVGNAKMLTVKNLRVSLADGTLG